MDALISLLQQVNDQNVMALQAGPTEWAYIALAVLVFVEGPMVTLLGAVAAASGWLDPYGVFAAAAIGNFAADNAWYLLGYVGKVEWVLRYGRWFGVRPQHLRRLRAEIHAHAIPMLLLAKVTASLAIPALVTAGLMRVPWRRTFLAVFIGECLWTGMLVFLGYHFAASLRRLQWGLQLISLIAAVIVLFLLLRYLHRFWWRRWSAPLDSSNPSPEER